MRKVGTRDMVTKRRNMVTEMKEYGDRDDIWTERENKVEVREESRGHEESSSKQFRQDNGTTW